MHSRNDSLTSLRHSRRHVLATACVIALSSFAAPEAVLANGQVQELPQGTTAAPATDFARVGSMTASGLPQSTTVTVSVDRNDIPADGQSVATLDIQVKSLDGSSVADGTPVTILVSAGTLQLPGAASTEAGIRPQDLDPLTPGMQIATQDGRATVQLVAPMASQTVDVQVTAIDAMASGKLHFIPALRPMIAAGLIDGVVSFNRKDPLSLGVARPNDGFDDAINSWSRYSSDGKRQAALRTAFFVKGEVRPRTLLTMSYDSDKPNRDRLFRDLDPERWYPVYGDASTVGFDARSSSRLYARLNRGRSYLMYGDVTTGDGFSQRFGQGDVASSRVRDLGQYSRSFTGVRGHAENERGYLDAFGAYDSLRQVVEEFPGRGLSGPYTVSNSAYAVLGTERVEVITRDRNAPSRVVDVRAMQRFSDYNFEPFSGRILFNAPIPSVDAELNPVSVRITYEVEQGGDRFWVYGVNGQYRVAPMLDIGASAAKDENPLAPFELYSANATIQFAKNTYLRGEYAQTRSMAGAWGGNIYSLTPALAGTILDGSAWRAEFGHKAQASELVAWYGESDRDFNNPASSFLGGRKQAGLSGLWWLGRGAAKPQWAIYGTGNWIQDELSEASRKQAQLGLRYQPSDRLMFEVGANYVDERAGDYLTNGATVPGSLNAPFGVGTVTPGFGGGFFGGSANAILPGSGQSLYNTGSTWTTGYGSWVGNGLSGVPVEYTALRLATNFKPAEKFEIGGEVQQDLNESSHRSASLGVAYRVNPRTRLFGRYQWNTGLNTVATSDTVINPVTGAVMPSPNQSDAFVFGLESEYLPGATAYSEYRMYDSFGERQAQIASGLRNRWTVSPRLSLETSAEKLQVLNGSGQAATAATVSANWRPSELWLLAGRLEWRTTDAITSLGNVGGVNTPSWINEGYDSWLSTVSIGRKISRDWTLLARNYYLLNTYSGSRPDSYENRFQIGFAYRDTDTNRFNLLAKYENWKRRDSVQNNWLPTPLSYDLSNGFDKQIASVHADWHPNRVWWVSGHLAAKDQTDLFASREDRFKAYLTGGRVTYALSERWDVSGMAYRMWSPDGDSQHALGAEVGRMLTSNLWLSAGYNARGFDSQDMVTSEYTNQGAFIRLRFKFDENIFQGRNPEINRALPR